MNDRHLALCASPEWARYVENRLLPWVLGEEDLGPDVLEFGPGPGLTTDVLLRVVDRLTAVEVDEGLADSLARRLTGTQLTVMHGDATCTGLPAARFSAVTCFTMLHHLPTPEHQDRLFAEALRVLRPAGVLLGTDGLDTPERRGLHVDDIFVPVDPNTLPSRLTAAGFTRVQVDLDGDRIRFQAVASSD